jgi:type II secretory pathway pseudopilin PulG
MLMLAVFVISLGLLIATPVWRTEIQREKEEELIFRGNQYVEAIRLYVIKNPGKYPSELQDLMDERCIRRLYPDPMTESGEWDLVLAAGGLGRGAGASVQRVLIAPGHALSSIQNPRILGVVSSSLQKSFKIYQDQESYDKWLFFYGKNPEKLPEIVYYGQEKK